MKHRAPPKLHSGELALAENDNEGSTPGKFHSCNQQMSATGIPVRVEILCWYAATACVSALYLNAWVGASPGAMKALIAANEMPSHLAKDDIGRGAFTSGLSGVEAPEYDAALTTISALWVCK